MFEKNVSVNQYWNRFKPIDYDWHIFGFLIYTFLFITGTVTNLVVIAHQIK